MADIRSQPVEEDSGLERTIKTVLLGDFYEHPTFSGIVVRTAVTALPFFDQIGDAQDVLAWVVKLRDTGWEGDFEDWVNSFVLGIGCVAVVGSVAKGAIKIVRSSEAASAVPKLLEHLDFFGKGEGIKWLKEFANDIHAYADQAADKIKYFLELLREGLDELKKLVPKHLAQKIEEWRAGIQRVRNQVDEMFAKIADEIKGKFDEAFGSFRKEALDMPSATKSEAHRMQKAGTEAKDRIFWTMNDYMHQDPELLAKVRKLEDEGWTIKYGPKGGGTYCQRSTKTIVIAEGKPAQSEIVSLAHEAGHANFPPAAPLNPRDYSKEDFIHFSVNEDMRNEGEALISGIETTDVMRSKGFDEIGYDLGTATPEDLDVLRSFDLKDPMQRNHARSMAGNWYREANPSTAPGKTYEQYYGEYWGTYWENHMGTAERMIPR